MSKLTGLRVFCFGVDVCEHTPSDSDRDLDHHHPNKSRNSHQNMFIIFRVMSMLSSIYISTCLCVFCYFFIHLQWCTFGMTPWYSRNTIQIYNISFFLLIWFLSGCLLEAFWFAFLFLLQWYESHHIYPGTSWLTLFVTPRDSNEIIDCFKWYFPLLLAAYSVCALRHEHVYLQRWFTHFFFPWRKWVNINKADILTHKNGEKKKVIDN